MARHSKQKRDQSAPTQTLHNFFNSKPLLSRDIKEKNSVPVREHEAIVIDSDSDDEQVVQYSTNKRQKLNHNYAEHPTIPKVEMEPSEKLLPTGHHLKENSSTATLQTGSSKSGQKSTYATVASKEDSSCFGNPFLLLNNFPEKTSQESVPSFGKPLLLTSSSKSMSSFSESRFVLAVSDSDSTSVLPTEATNVDVDLTLDDWGDDDDERPIESKSDDDSDIEFVSLDDRHSKDTAGEDPQFFSARSSEKGGNGLTPLSSGFDPLVLGPPSTNAPQTKSSSSCTSKNTHDTRSNAFAFLMSSKKETEIWKETMTSKDKTLRPQKDQGNRRKAPFYKVLQGMPIAVDAFNFGKIPDVTAYFLTHAHSDHYTNLSSSWKNGPIYCSQGTANLIIHKLSVDKKWVHPVPMDTATIIPDTNGVTVTLIEANHCPGSCLFFFEGLQTVNAGDSTFKSSYVGSSRVFRYLHCGDFRASPQHVLHPAVRGKVIDHVYLDTTYLDPKYTFPPQPLVISACAELARRIVSGENSTAQEKSAVLSWVQSSDKGKGKGKEKDKGRPLVVIGTYSIGKERIAKAIAQALSTKIYCDARKKAILKCQDDPELHALLTSDPQEGFVHLVPLGSITTDHLKSYLEGFGGSYARIIGFRPTGWTYTQAAGTNQSPSIQSIISASQRQSYSFTDLVQSSKSATNLSLYPVPYSEHSSFYELTCFAMSFNWIKMIATVNVGSEKSRAKMTGWIAKWEAERKKRGRDTIVPYSSPDYWG